MKSESVAFFLPLRCTRARGFTLRVLPTHIHVPTWFPSRTASRHRSSSYAGRRASLSYISHVRAERPTLPDALRVHAEPSIRPATHCWDSTAAATAGKKPNRRLPPVSMACVTTVLMVTHFLSWLSLYAYPVHGQQMAGRCTSRADRNRMPRAISSSHDHDDRTTPTRHFCQQEGGTRRARC